MNFVVKIDFSNTLWIINVGCLDKNESSTVLNYLNVVNYVITWML